jgi:serine O-acetyltransferase
VVEVRVEELGAIEARGGEMSNGNAALAHKDDWGREALSRRVGGSEDELIAVTLDFIQSYLSSTPLRSYGGLFEREQGAVGEPLTESLLDALACFRSDLARWQLDIEAPADLITRLQLAPTLQATFFYRVCRALFMRQVKLIPDVVANLSRLVTAVEIYYSADIGPGLKLIHGLGTVIGAMCTIGSHSTIYQNVTVGDKLGRETGKRPVIGDYVILSAGAQVLGPLTIGPKAVVGANSVVLGSIPGHCVAAGAPATKVADLSEERFQEFWDSIKG